MSFESLFYNVGDFENLKFGVHFVTAILVVFELKCSECLVLHYV